MLSVAPATLTAITSLPLRGAWIEIPHYAFAPSTRRPSLPLRGAWIEMSSSGGAFVKGLVAPLAGGVD